MTFFAELASHLAHDLRAGARRQNIFIDQLQGGETRSIAQTARRLSVTARQSERLSQSLEDISELLSASVTLAPSKLSALAASAEKDVQRTRAGQAALALRVENDIDFLADAALMSQALRHLFENAIDAAPTDAVAHTRLEAETSGAWLTISVSDDGPGFSDAQAAVLASPFSRLAQRDEWATKGLGLGLALCAEVVRRHGGDMRLESNAPSPGATVRLRLPAHGG